MCTSNKNNDKAQLLINTNDVIVKWHCGKTNVLGWLQLFNVDLALILLHLNHSGSDLTLSAPLQYSGRDMERREAKNLMSHSEMSYKVMNKRKKRIEATLTVGDPLSSYFSHSRSVTYVVDRYILPENT